MKHIVLFASGSGTNVENIVRYFSGNPQVSIDCVFTNNRDAKVLDRCNLLNISSLCFNKTAFYDSDCITTTLLALNPDLIVLAGFLWKIPKKMIENFPGKIINIHPALLPKYGGKGMYGMHIHNAVWQNKELETGITVHYVNENYDEGAIIRQIKTPLSNEDTALTIAEKIHALEQENFPKIIAGLLHG